MSPVERPKRLSQTLLRYFDMCPRSAYLSVKHGDKSSHAMMRGRAFHEFAKRAILHCIEHDEPKVPPEVAKDLMAEMLEDPRFAVPAHEVARLWLQADHFARGFKVAPERVLSVERKFVLDVDGHTLSFRPDYAEISEDGRTVKVYDWKSEYRIKSETEMAEVWFDQYGERRITPKTFQLLAYVLAIALGHPMVKSVDYDTGEVVERKGEALARRVQSFQCFEGYPQYLFDDGIAVSAAYTVTRDELIDRMAWLKGLVRRTDAAFTHHEQHKGKAALEGFPAMDGSHCNRCPAQQECPISKNVRYKTIETPEQASEEASSYEQAQAQQKRRWQALKDWGEEHGDVPFGTDQAYAFKEQKGRRSTDHEGMAAGAREAAELGTEFDPQKYVKQSPPTTVFRKVKL